MIRMGSIDYEVVPIDGGKYEVHGAIITESFLLEFFGKDRVARARAKQADNVIELEERRGSIL